MSYFVSAIIVILVLLSFIAFFDEAREVIKTRQRRANKAKNEKLIAGASSMNGQLHKMELVSFQKLVTYIYEKIGYRTKTITAGKESAIILEQNGVYTLMIYKNHIWPISRDTLETCYYHKTKMGLDAMMVISIGGFNVSGWEWSKDQSDVKLINEERFIDLCNEIAVPRAAG